MDDELKLIDLSALERDPQLLAELRAMGWPDDATDTAAASMAEGMEAAASNNEIGDDDDDDDDDDVDIALDESDYSNPELLSLLQSLSPDKTVDVGELTREAASPAPPHRYTQPQVPIPLSATPTQGHPAYTPQGPALRPLPPKAVMPAAVAAAAAVSTPVPPPVVLDSNEEAYRGLQRALSEARDGALSDAKALKERSRLKEAAEKMRQYKKYVQEMEVLSSRRAAGSPCALFRWRSEKYMQRVENFDIGEGFIRVEIDRMTAFDSSLVPVGGTISLDYCLNIPKDAPIKGVATGKRGSAGVVEFGYSHVHKIDTRSKTLQSLITRKKATFSLYTRKWSLFGGGASVALGQASMPLADLNTVCTLTQDSLPLYEDDGGQVAARRASRSRALPGALRVSLSLRTPLRRPQEEQVHDRVLVVGEWRDGQPPLLPSPAPVLVPPPSSSGVDSSSSSSSGKLGDRFSSLSDLEKEDPFSVDLLESNDVMSAEITELIAAQRSPAGPEEDEDETGIKSSILAVRMTLLETKQSILQLRVRQQKLSLQDYMYLVKARIERDRLLALYLSGPGVDKGAAVRVLKRVKIMQAEMAGVEEG